MISIHAPARGATGSGWITPGHSGLFQSTLPRGERRLCRLSADLLIYDFNPRSREGSDAHGKELGSSHADFNPRSREGSDEPSYRGRITVQRFQSTLPRGERLQIHLHFMNPAQISIHAPARGATFFQQLLSFFLGFQSTLPRGERPVFLQLFGLICTISIHAPARGATCCSKVLAKSSSGFQSTLPRGERPRSLSPLSFPPGFQSTLPRGERLQFYLKFTLCF